MFYRLVKMSGKWYSLKIESVEEDVESIEEFASQGQMVVICDDLEWFANEFEIELDDIQIVEKHDE